MMSEDFNFSNVVMPKAPVKNRARRRQDSHRHDEDMDIGEPVRPMAPLDDVIDWNFVAAASSEDILDELGVSKLQDSTDSDYNTASDNSANSAGLEAEQLLQVALQGDMLDIDEQTQRLLEDAAVDAGLGLQGLLTSQGSVQTLAVTENRPARRPTQNIDYINSLAEEVLLHVFRWLSKSTLAKCARVCKRWHVMALDESLWRRMDLAGKTVQPGVMGVCLDRGVSVLRLARAEVLTPLYSDPFPSPRLCRVQFLDLSMSSIEVPALEELLSMCRYLRKLSLENCTVTDKMCRYIGHNKNLEVLNFCMVNGLTENGLVPICNNLQRLDALNVSWTGMSRGAVLYLIICLPPGLQKLNLSGCRDTLLDEDVQQLCRSCPHLRELDLSDCTQLRAASVETVAGGLRGLEYLALSRCYNITPNSLPSLRRIHSLLAVDVFGMLKESALRQLRAAMPNIEINKFPFSSIARPTTGIRRTSIWGLRVRD